MYLLGYVGAGVVVSEGPGIEGASVGDTDAAVESVDVNGVHQEQRTPIPSTLLERLTVFPEYSWYFSDFST